MDTNSEKKKQRVKLILTVQNSKDSWHLESMNLDALDFKMLIEMYNGPPLKRVNLNNNCLQNQGLGLLASNRDLFESLKTLGLIRNRIQAQGIKFLSMNPWKHLQILHLSNNQIGCLGVKYLVNFISPSIQQLILDDNILQDRALSYLQKGPLGSLKILSISWNFFTHQGFKQLQKSQFKNLKTILLLQQTNSPFRADQYEFFRFESYNLKHLIIFLIDEVNKLAVRKKAYLQIYPLIEAFDQVEYRSQ